MPVKRKCIRVRRVSESRPLTSLPFVLLRRQVPVTKRGFAYAPNAQRGFQVHIWDISILNLNMGIMPSWALESESHRAYSHGRGLRS